MADKSEIEGWRQGYQKYSDEELVAVMHEKDAHCAQHIAAAQVLHARELQRQAELDARSAKRHRQTQFVAWIAAAFAAAGVVVGVIQHCSSKPSANSQPAASISVSERSSSEVPTAESVSPRPATTPSTSTPTATPLPPSTPN